MTDLDVPSRTSVRRAGEALKNPALDQKHALMILSKWRSLHAYPINAFQTLLRKKVGEKAIIAQRLKRLPSIISKLQRFQDMGLERMQDIGGVRIVLPSVKDVYALHDDLLKSRFEHEALLPPKDYIKTPKQDGYRCLHQVFKYNSKIHPSLNGLCIELQIRTKLQHAWATAVETLGIIERASFKTGEGSEEFKTFFKLSSALFAMKENTTIVSDYADYTKEQLIAEIKALETQLQVTRKLSGLAITNRHIESVTMGSADYHLIELLKHGDKWRVSLTTFTKSQIKSAEQLYEAKESEAKTNPNIDVVLVSAGDLKQLRKAYPNYFLDTNVFIQQLADLLH
jgi:putative GTP pyrophosphokinase